jgi:ankyrin repeat protein
MLIAAGADVDAAPKEGITALHVAASGSHPETIALLVEAGSKMNPSNHTRGRTPLHEAVLSGRQENVRLLLAAGADPTIVDKSSLAPLHYAEHWGHEACAKLLREAMVGRKVTPSPKARRAIKLLKDQSLEYLGHETGLKSE